MALSTSGVKRSVQLVTNATIGKGGGVKLVNQDFFMFKQTKKKIKIFLKSLRCFRAKL